MKVAHPTPPLMAATPACHDEAHETCRASFCKLQSPQPGPSTPDVGKDSRRRSSTEIEVPGPGPRSKELFGTRSSSSSLRNEACCSTSSSNSDWQQQQLRQQLAELGIHGSTSGHALVQQQDHAMPCCIDSTQQLNVAEHSLQQQAEAEAQQRLQHQPEQEAQQHEQASSRSRDSAHQVEVAACEVLQQEEVQAREQIQQLSDDEAGPSISAAAVRTSRADEPLLQDNPRRYTMKPVEYDDFWMMYKQQLASYWTVDEVDLSGDLRDWQKLTSNEQHFIKYVLAFFAGSDGIVLENLAVRFMQDIQIPEVRAFYGFQIAMENIHSEMYSVLLETYVADRTERLQLLDAINNVPIISKKAAWAMKWISSTSSFAQRLLAFACVEGIHFSGSFCAIFWLKKRGLMPGLTFSNELISRDEGLHTDFACLLYKYMVNRLAESEVHQLVGEAVLLEQEFICEALKCEVVGMNARLMGEYIQYVADRLLVSLGYSKLYNASNPFDWMEMISLQGKANFFERRVGDYQKAGVMGGLKGRPTFEHFVFTTDEDF